MVILELLASQFLVLTTTYAIVVFDRGRLDPLRRARAWNGASTGTALLFFAPVCIVAHFWITRRSLRGIAIGIGWLVVAFTLIVVLGIVPMELLPLYLLAPPMWIGALPGLLVTTWLAGW